VKWLTYNFYLCSILLREGIDWFYLFPPIQLIFKRYNMRRLEVDSKQEEGCDLSSNHISSGEESSADEQIGTLEASDSKIEELHRSVSRLREFVAAIPAQKL
jgi:hypothetical protein